MYHLPEENASDGINEPIGNINSEVKRNENVTIVRTALLNRNSKYFWFEMIYQAFWMLNSLQLLTA